MSSVQRTGKISEQIFFIDQHHAKSKYRIYNILLSLLWGTVFVPYYRYNLQVVQSVLWGRFLSHITAVTYQLYHMFYGDIFGLI